MRTIDLRQREVINITTAERLGFITDVEMDSKSGLVESVVVPKRLGLFTKKQEYLIPWDKIVSIGRDIVLVELSDGDVVR